MMNLKPILTALFILAVCCATAQVIPVAKSSKKGVSKGRKVATSLTPAINTQMVYVEGGSFIMGNNDGPDRERPAHNVTISSFYLSNYELTVGEFRKFINATGYKTTAEKQGWSELWIKNDWQITDGVTWRDGTSGKRRPSTEDNHPVIHISFDDADNYCKWLSGQTGKLYRLPTEAEWEYAAKGGNKTKSLNNVVAENIDAIAWYKGNSGGKTHPVGKKQPNELGLYDMMGNVSEWCKDWADFEYYASSPSNDPQGPAMGNKRVHRGGMWSGSIGKYTQRMDSGVNVGNITGLRLALSR